MMQQVWLAFYGLTIGAGYAAALQFAVPGESALLPVRGLNMVLFMVVYGWCCGKDRLTPPWRPLVEIPLIPLALLGALLVCCVWLVSFVFTWLSSFLWRTTTR